MNLVRDARHEKLFEFLKDDFKKILELVPANHKIQKPRPLIKRLFDDSFNKLRVHTGEALIERFDKTFNDLENPRSKSAPDSNRIKR